MILHLDKQDLLQYMLDITFPKKCDWVGRKGDCKWKGVSGIYKNFHLIVLEGVH